MRGDPNEVIIISVPLKCMIQSIAKLFSGCYSGKSNDLGIKQFDVSAKGDTACDTAFFSLARWLTGLRFNKATSLVRAGYVSALDL